MNFDSSLAMLLEIWVQELFVAISLREQQLVLQYQMISPENIHRGNIAQIEQIGFRNIYTYITAFNNNY